MFQPGVVMFVIVAVAVLGVCWKAAQFARQRGDYDERVRNPTSPARNRRRRPWWIMHTSADFGSIC